MHKVTEGGADKSYGIYVAKLAGLPERIISRARTIMGELERAFARETRLSNIPRRDGPYQKEFLLDPYLDIIQQIKDLDIDKITPLQAISVLHDMQLRIRSQEEQLQ